MQLFYCLAGRGGQAGPGRAAGRTCVCPPGRHQPHVSALGLLVAQAVGSTQLTGIMHGFDGDEHVTYGEDVVQVHVRLLSGVRVHTP